ncbi:barrier to autointegration factor [Cooperia oncophora]
MSTKKAREFVGEPMGDKWAHDIPGIGPEYGARLAEQGLPKAANVFGQFLVHNGDRDRVVGWLKVGLELHNLSKKNKDDLMSTKPFIST